MLGEPNVFVISFRMNQNILLIIRPLQLIVGFTVLAPLEHGISISTAVVIKRRTIWKCVINKVSDPKFKFVVVSCSL